MQVSLVILERTLHKVQNYLLYDDKNCGFIEVWMLADTGRVSISRFCSGTEQ